MKNRNIGILLVLAAMLVIPFTAAAKKPNLAMEATRTFSGVIIDKMTQEELGGVYLYFEELQKGIYSGPDGKFDLEGIQPGTYNVTVKYISYHESQVVVKVKKSKKNFKTFQLEPIEP